MVFLVCVSVLQSTHGMYGVLGQCYNPGVCYLVTLVSLTKQSMVSNSSINEYGNRIYFPRRKTNLLLHFRMGTGCLEL